MPLSPPSLLTPYRDSALDTMATSIGHQQVYAAFQAKLGSCQRVNYKGSVFYHPVEDIRNWLLASNEQNVSNAGLLLHYSYPASIFALTRPEDISNALLVFAILLKLGCGHLIHVFCQVIHDGALDASFRREDLHNDVRRSMLPHPHDIVDQFERCRWSFCPVKIEDICHNTKAYLGGRWILPFCRRELIGEGGTAFVHGVLLQKDIVPERLQNDLLRGHEYQDPRFGEVSSPAWIVYGP
jgi:hypothetical protein